MADTEFVPGTVITSEWLNVVNDHIYHPVNDAPLIGIIGDSNTAQPANVEPSWPDHLKAALNNLGSKANILNASKGGMTCYQALINEYFQTSTPVEVLQEHSPVDIILVPLGAVENLINPDGRTINQRKADAEALFSTLRTNHPSAKIYYVSQVPYDTINFTTSSIKNKGVLPALFTLKSTGYLANAYCSEMLDDTITTYLTPIQDWESWDLYVKALGTIDGWFEIDYWRIARMGCMGPDGLHMSQMGHILSASYVLKGIYAKSDLLSQFPTILDYDTAKGTDPDVLFDSILTVSGDGYTVTTTDLADMQSISRMWPHHDTLHPDSWYLPSKAQCHVTPTTFSVRAAGITSWVVIHGPAGEQVYGSGDGSAFGAVSGCVTDSKGFVLVAADTDNLFDWAAGTHYLRLKIKNEIYGPFTLTVTDTIGHTNVYATRSTTQSINSSANTTVIFNNEVQDALGEYNTSTGVFTASNAGAYLVVGSAGLDSLNDGTIIACNISKNGSEYAIGTTFANALAAASPTTSCTSIIRLAAGETIDFKIYHNYGSARNVTASSTKNYILIQRIAP